MKFFSFQNSYELKFIKIVNFEIKLIIFLKYTMNILYLKKMITTNI